VKAKSAEAKREVAWETLVARVEEEVEGEGTGRAKLGAASTAGWLREYVAIASVIELASIWGREWEERVESCRGKGREERSSKLKTGAKGWGGVGDRRREERSKVGEAAVSHAGRSSSPPALSAVGALKGSSAGAA
jgi:hypothetical protein